MTAEHTLPQAIADEAELDDLLSAPGEAAVRAMGELEGDLILLGAGGKMGPTLARMARRASEAAGVSRRIIAVSRFTDPAARRRLDRHGVRTLTGDLLEPRFIAELPDAPHIVFMTGMKFGTAENPALAWAMNTRVPALVCERYPRGCFLVFSTGNVYPLTPVDGRGARETDPPGPIGEYAMSALGRERIFEYFSDRHGAPLTIVRLNYACEMRYGVLLDIARKVQRREPIDLTTGRVNVIWQGDANAMALAALADAARPPFIINITGPEVLSVRRVAERFGELLGRPPRFTGREADTALLSDASRACQRYGRPPISAERMIRWIADWVQRDGPTLDKPTHFEVRDGRF